MNKPYIAIDILLFLGFDFQICLPRGPLKFITTLGEKCSICQTMHMLQQNKNKKPCVHMWSKCPSIHLVVPRVVLGLSSIKYSFQTCFVIYFCPFCFFCLLLWFWIVFLVKGVVLITVFLPKIFQINVQW